MVEECELIEYRSIARFLLEGIEGLYVLAFTLVAWPFAGNWLKNWGSLVTERGRVWRGDQLVNPNHETVTRAINVETSGEDVWSWIVQFGLGRAGFYSYELLERLVGISVVNVESVVPSLQKLAVGDEIFLHPKEPGIPIAYLKKGKYLCFGEEPNSRPIENSASPSRSWSMYIESTTANQCRLILRSCIEPTSGVSWTKRVVLAIEKAIDFVMEQRMLRTIKRLSEGA